MVASPQNVDHLMEYFIKMYEKQHCFDTSNGEIKRGVAS